ncbi:Dot/Icm T4SS effector AnkG/AnkZ/LegA7 [Legionella hackeliae]|uniref:Uncharacterized protein n=1 Tax=Legionella hackeliae TaxID=449 RepID=A0A0A8UL81_LEGHA|nr:Dot/Icm T4SS effector AnkG/AnkZ/LegA7 [Legionella hackeliae]KTD14886.1 ankyrin repeat-containing protein [Legionella hackeliae]CEK09488.1 protein of unknown function [ankyrin repeat] [Legionella hackeliae]STX49394.1 ankyrin repeat-containing protein [Legionella hackeliae]
MIYVVYLLLMVATIIVVKRLLVTNSESLTTNSKYLKHSDILSLLDYFDYVHDDGVCFGFTVTWAQDAALDNDQSFYQRLNLIRQHKHHITSKIERINLKIKSKEAINWYEDQLLDVQSFFESVCLAQSPEEYDDVYAKRLNQTNIDTILSLIRHKLARNNHVKRFLLKTVALDTSEDAIDYFTQLHQLLKMTDKVSMVLSCENHAVGLKKLDTHWLFIDINKLYRQNDEYPYLILNHEGLVAQLSESFSDKQRLIFNTDFIAAHPSLELKRRLQQLNDIYPVFREQVPYKNSREVGFLAISAQNGEERTVRQILNLHNNFDYLSPAQISDAVSYAIGNNQKSVINLLIKARGFKINYPCGSEKLTPLAMACDYGYLDLVRIFLACDDVMIDARNKDGRTPLMLACQSPYTHTNTVLFKELLDAGASLTLVDKNGEDALTLAENVSNSAAISILGKFRVQRRPLNAVTTGHSLFTTKEYTRLRLDTDKNAFLVSTSTSKL